MPGGLELDDQGLFQLKPMNIRKQLYDLYTTDETALKAFPIRPISILHDVINYQCYSGNFYAVPGTCWHSKSTAMIPLCVCVHRANGSLSKSYNRKGCKISLRVGKWSFCSRVEH